MPPPVARASRWTRLVKVAHQVGLGGEPNELGDFTTTPRVIFMSLLAVLVGGLGAGAAWFMIRFIAILSNALFFGRWGIDYAFPTDRSLGVLLFVIVVAGGIIVGFMERFGTEDIRGDGVPGAIESALIHGSKVPPKIAFWKPIASAVTIGFGGPFGAEGPIIATGGALGSLLAQFLRLTSSERKTLLVAGASAGLAGIFGTPVAAVLLGVELLLFEFKPRSMIPVAVACATSGLLRYYIIGYAPLFHVPTHAVFPGTIGMLSCVLVGILAGILSVILTIAVHTFEKGYHRLPVHWMWWPAVGAVVVGIGGIIEPRALGVGYADIRLILNGHLAMKVIITLLIVKAVIWSVALASGTSGGVIAPVMLIGCALGAVEGLFLPHLGIGYWALISLGATFGSIYRAPMMSIIFTIELTHDVNMLLPLLLAVYVAYGVTVLAFKRSILTEPIAEHGYHVSLELSIDPLEILRVREVMRTHFEAIPAETPLTDLDDFFQADPERRRQALYPVVNDDKQMVGIVTRTTIIGLGRDHVSKDTQVDTLAVTDPVVAYPDEQLSTVIYRMARTGFTRLPVVESTNPRKLLGIISLDGVLTARLKNMEAERRRERVLDPHMLFPFWPHTPNPPSPPPPPAVDADAKVG